MTGLRPPLCTMGGALLLAWAAAAPAFAANAQVPLGARALAMGGAYSAVADDASALFWNPAALARVGHQELAFGHANLFGLDIRDDWLAFVLPLSPRQAVGIDWYHSGLRDADLEFGENRIDLAWSWRPHDLVAVGATGKFVGRETALDGATVRDGRGFGADLAVLAQPLAPLSLAVVAQDLGTRLAYDGAGRTEIASTWRAAAAWSFRVATVAVDLDDRWHVGVEAAPIEAVALRGGAQRAWDGEEETTWSFGAGFRAGILRLDWARELHPDLGATDHFGAGIAFHFNPSQVRIEQIAANDLYASQYPSYAREPVGRVRLRNLQSRPLPVTLSVALSGVAPESSMPELVLNPLAVAEVPVTAVLPPEVLATDANRRVELQVRARYQSLRLERSDEARARTVLYGRGAIDWSAGLAPAAAFVTVADPTVVAFAREACREVVAQRDSPFGVTHLDLAAAMFEAVAAHGVGYVRDPNNPFDAISERPHAVDTVQYPAETLERRAGDCDDTTVLLAALLGNVGIATRLVDVPGHLFLLFDSGLPARGAMALGLPDSFAVVQGGRVWIPLESTLLADGFASAWRVGAETWRRWAAEGAATSLPVDSAQSRFVPGSLPPRAAPIAPPDAGRVALQVVARAGEVDAWRREHLASAAAADSRPSLRGPLRAARVLARAGRLAEARARLETARATAPEAPALLNADALLLAAEGRFAEARERLDRAIALDPADAGLHLNSGLIAQAAEDDAAARRAFAEGVRRAGGLGPALALLGESMDGPTSEPDPQRAADVLIARRAAAAKAAAAAPETLLKSAYWKEVE